MSAFGGKADIAVSEVDVSLLTQSGHWPFLRPGLDRYDAFSI
jgi:hypothetical protein